MSAISKVVNYDKCVYWQKTGEDEYGKPTYAAPVQLGCRWDERQEEFVNREGRTEMSMAKVIVGDVVEVGGVLWHGTLQDVPNMAVPFDNPEAWEIKQTKNTPNKKNTETLRHAYL